MEKVRDIGKGRGRRERSRRLRACLGNRIGRVGEGLNTGLWV